jgi:hypothetical protein
MLSNISNHTFTKPLETLSSEYEINKKEKSKATRALVIFSTSVSTEPTPSTTAIQKEMKYCELIPPNLSENFSVFNLRITASFLII